ncbi:hypothetical protein EDB85DRAFT_2005660 [Lactarius pseudohatsudake]|nr:hypothetical protein EDB85DRAFT_2005660 [Lactarius pseudohatsudake]
MAASLSLIFLTGTRALSRCPVPPHKMATLCTRQHLTTYHSYFVCTQAPRCCSTHLQNVFSFFLFPSFYLIEETMADIIAAAPCVHAGTSIRQSPLHQPCYSRNNSPTPSCSTTALPHCRAWSLRQLAPGPQPSPPTLTTSPPPG